MHLIIISSNFYSAARRGGPYFLDEKKVCKDSRGSRVSAAAPVGALFVCHRHTAPPRPQGLFCLSLAAHFSLSAWPACALRVTKRRPLYRNTRNLTIAKVPPHFWGYGMLVASGQHPPPWLRRLCRVRSAFCYALEQTFLALLEKTRALCLVLSTGPRPRDAASARSPHRRCVGGGCAS